MAELPGGSVLFRSVEVAPGHEGDCRVRGGRIVALAPRLRAAPGENVVDGGGGALLPGLADHHLHLTAMAAQAASVDLSGRTAPTLGRTIRGAAPGPDGWIRATGYDDGAHGPMNREILDTWAGGRPVRVQHRSGVLWVVNSAALQRLGADSTAAPPGVERDRSGRATGRLWRVDGWLRERIGARPPSLTAIGARLAAFGITHVTDATPDSAAVPVLAGALHRGELPQYVTSLAAHRPAPVSHPRLRLGARKLVVADHELPELAALVREILASHAARRPVAVHCVTPAALALTLAALDEAGHHAGDRIEHCALADAAAVRELAARRLRVITQPTFIARRGDAYLERTPPAEHADLWRYGSLLRAGVATAPGSDAPYGDPDPWACLRAARDRTTPSGRVLGPGERTSTVRVLRGMLSRPCDPGGPPRRLSTGARADLVLLHVPLDEALRHLDSALVRATYVGGRAVYGPVPPR